MQTQVHIVRVRSMESLFLNFRLWRALIVAWLVYIAYIMGRKPVSIVRSEITAYLSPIMSGLLDTAFLTTYSLVGERPYPDPQHLIGGTSWVATL